MDLTDNDYDMFIQGYRDAKYQHLRGVDITSHYSQGELDYDRGWNAYIDEVEDGNCQGDPNFTS